MKEGVEGNPFELLGLTEQEPVKPEMILGDPLNDFIPKLTDPDFDDFCEWIGLRNNSDSHP
jgi:hypothetical protein